MSARPQNRPEWQNTWLWKTLVKRSEKSGNDGAREFLPTLTAWMKLLDDVLSSGGTSPLDFTLHDASHSLRVADRIEQLLTTATRKNLSDYELALLLLAAYGHDIGMTPERKKVQAHHRHLFDPAHSTLTDAEKEQFQKFLDDYHARTVSLPLCTGTPTVDDLNLADELTAFYVRDRHNDWSAEWIRDNLKGSLAFLNDATETLVRLCASHHWGFERLMEGDFAPRRIGNPHPQIIHLRYLACLLRLADILENDPERTPEVIFRHRSMEERRLSIIHWQKDHALTIDLQGDQIRFEARPRCARVHKALLQLAGWIDHELHGIAAFGEKLPDHFEVGGKNVHRDWALAPALMRDIQPAPGTYEYIDGAFRPNTQRLLHLLSGEQLYGEPLAAVRELLQNAFDAVREKIARRRLQSHVKNPGDPALEQQFGNEEHVTLTLQRRKVRDGETTEIQPWLICEDSGVGLTKALITGHLLVSGQSQRHDIMALERRCEAAGFHLGRTGQFGIGVLSYFMLANEVRLTTTRYQACDDLDEPGWSFTTHGVGDFGELRIVRPSPFPQGGSRFELRLRSEKCADTKAFAVALLDYLKRTLVRLPCAFMFQTEGFGMEPITWEKATGWTLETEDFLATAQAEWLAPDKLKGEAEHLLDESELKQQRKTHELYPDWIIQARTALCCEIREIDLPTRLGTARLALPYFALAGGRSLAFLFQSEGNRLHKVDGAGRYGGEGHGLRLSLTHSTSWKGINAPVTHGEQYYDRRTRLFVKHSSCAVFLDFTHADGSLLQVSRDGVKLPDAVATEIRSFLAAKIDSFADEVLSPERAGIYHLLNSWARGKKLTPMEDVGWFTRELVDSELQPVFAKISLPAVATYQGIGRVISRPTGQLIHSFGMGEYAFRLYNHKPTWTLPASVKSVIFRSGKEGVKQMPVAFWERRAPGQSDEVIFPPEWKDVLSVNLEGGLCCLNRSHPVNGLLTVAQASELYEIDPDSMKIPWEDLDSASSQSDAAWFLCRLAFAINKISHKQEWEKFQKNHQQANERIWSLAAGEGKSKISDLQLAIYSLEGSVLLNADGVETRYDSEWNLYPVLPLVTDEAWILRQANVGELVIPSRTKLKRSAR